MNELKPCPFCKSRAEHYSFNYRKHTVRCVYCLADCGEHDTPERAAFVWNTRPAEDALKSEVGRLREALTQIGIAMLYSEDEKADEIFKLCEEKVGDPLKKAYVEKLQEDIEKMGLNPETEKGGEMSKVIICSVCGGMNIQTERRPNGDRHCLDCGSRWKIGSEQVSKKQTLFARITQSPEALGEKLVYRYDGNGTWRSFLLYGYEFLTQAEAIAATVARLKEVSNAR